MKPALTNKNSRRLSQLLLDLVLWRLFLPLLAAWLLAIGGVAFWGIKTLENQQQKTAQSIAQMVDSHLEQGMRILDTVSLVGEELSLKDINAFMGSTWKAYKHFDTIYYLDKNSRIKLLVPFDPGIMGLDMSRLSDIQQGEEKDHIVISRPFISLRTGKPTVYLIRKLSLGGRIVGELNLGAFQDEIVRLRGPSDRDSISILDQSGTLLAHPDVSQVKQQTNLAALRVLLHSADAAAVIYRFAGTRVLGSVARVDRVGWIVVDQIPISILLGPYALTLGCTLVVSLGIWLALMWNLRKKLDQHIVAPLVQLSQSTNAIAVGDFNHANSLVSLPASFSEISKLSEDFLHMSKELQAHHAALLEAQEELVRKEKLAILGQLSGSVGHELRNPLGVMSSAIYLLKMTKADADETTKEYLDIIKQAIDESLRIITDLLDFARTKPPERANISVSELINASLEKCTIPKNVSISKNISETDLLMIDQHQIVQVLQNLITNGIQAMPDGGYLMIQAEGDKEEKTIRINIIDSGEGITPENVKKLFQPLFTTKVKGIGLGLVVCKNLVEANGGRIEVMSKAGKGSVFSILLPTEGPDTGDNRPEA